MKAKELRQFLEETKINILVPLFHNKHLLGIFGVGSKFMGQSFTSLDLKILEFY